LTVCTHLILNLPWDTDDDAAAASKLVSVLPTDIVKVHSLYIARNSAMAASYLNHEFEICTAAQYLERAVLFLELLRPDIAVERLFSRIPEADAVFSNWGISWWKLSDMLSARMSESGSFQGCRFNYTNGSRLQF